MFDGDQDRDRYIDWFREKLGEKGFAFTAFDRTRYAEALRQRGEAACPRCVGVPSDRVCPTCDGLGRVKGYAVGTAVEVVGLKQYEGQVGQVVDILFEMPVKPLFAVRLRGTDTTVDVTAAHLRAA